MPYSIWIAPAMPQNCTCKLAARIIIVTCGQVAHISLNHWRINPVWKRKLLLNGQLKCKRRLTKCNALTAYPNHNYWFGIYWCLWLPVRCMYYPRREAGCLLLLQADTILAELYYNEKRNPFHLCNSKRISRYAPQCRNSCFHGP
jgi:hypothetical protein